MKQYISGTDFVKLETFFVLDMWGRNLVRFVFARAPGECLIFINVIDRRGISATQGTRLIFKSRCLINFIIFYSLVIIPVTNPHHVVITNKIAVHVWIAGFKFPTVFNF